VTWSDSTIPVCVLVFAVPALADCFSRYLPYGVWIVLSGALIPACLLLGEGWAALAATGSLVLALFLRWRSQQPRRLPWRPRRRQVREMRRELERVGVDIVHAARTDDRRVAGSGCSDG
jgi:hypothetical protein